KRLPLLSASRATLSRKSSSLSSSSKASCSAPRAAACSRAKLTRISACLPPRAKPTKPRSLVMTKTETPSGHFEGRTHILPVRVYYEDTDFSGVVYHAKYLHFMERGRSEFLRAAGVRHQGMLKTEEPLVWVVRHIAIDYLKPARVDDE